MSFTRYAEELPIEDKGVTTGRTNAEMQGTSYNMGAPSPAVHQQNVIGGKKKQELNDKNKHGRARKMKKIAPKL